MWLQYAAAPLKADRDVASMGDLEATKKAVRQCGRARNMRA